jgi:lysophospholipase L1-like esterase
MFGEADAGDLPDEVHPNAAGHDRMGTRFADHAFAPGGPFSGLG